MNEKSMEKELSNEIQCQTCGSLWRFDWDVSAIDPELMMCPMCRRSAN